MNTDTAQMCSYIVGEGAAVIAIALFVAVFLASLRKEKRRELFVNWIAMRDPFGIRFWLGNIPLMIAFLCLLAFFFIAGNISETDCNM